MRNATNNLQMQNVADIFNFENACMISQQRSNKEQMNTVAQYFIANIFDRCMIK